MKRSFDIMAVQAMDNLIGQELLAKLLESIEKQLHSADAEFEIQRKYQNHGTSNDDWSSDGTDHDGSIESVNIILQSFMFSNLEHCEKCEIIFNMWITSFLSNEYIRSFSQD